MYLLRLWIDQYLHCGGTDVDTDDLVSVAEVTVEMIVGERLLILLASVVGVLPNGVMDLSSVLFVNGNSPSFLKPES